MDSKRYGIKSLLLNSDALMPISKESYEDIINSINCLFYLLYIEEQFDILLENYYEFETAVLNLCCRQMLFNLHSYDTFQAAKNHFNRQLSNLLSSARMYIDHSKKHSHNILNSHKISSNEIDNEFNVQYDEKFGYRVMEALRNHVQHIGFPFHSISFSMKRIDEDKLKNRQYSISLYLTPESIRNDKSFKQSILKELCLLGDKVDIKPLLVEYIEGIWLIHSKARSIFETLAEKWEKTISDAIYMFSQKFPTESLSSLYAVIQSLDNKIISKDALFIKHIEYRKRLEEKNQNLNNLGYRFVSNKMQYD